MTDWHDVLPLIMSSLDMHNDNGISTILEFLKILPEEVTEGRKFNLSVRSSTDLQLQLQLQLPPGQAAVVSSLADIQHPRIHPLYQVPLQAAAATSRSAITV